MNSKELDINFVILLVFASFVIYFLYKGLVLLLANRKEKQSNSAPYKDQ